MKGIDINRADALLKQVNNIKERALSFPEKDNSIGIAIHSLCQIIEDILAHMPKSGRRKEKE